MAADPAHSSTQAPRWLNAALWILGGGVLILGTLVGWKWWTQPDPIILVVEEPVGERMLCAIVADGVLMKYEGAAPFKLPFYVDEFRFAAITAEPGVGGVKAGLRHLGGTGKTTTQGVEGRWTRGGPSVLGGMYNPDVSLLRSSWDGPIEDLQGFDIDAQP
jgi:hypothetical protein